MSDEPNALHVLNAGAEYRQMLTVGEPCDDPSQGQWYCTDHDYAARNNMEAHSHARTMWGTRDRIRCSWVWLCFDHGPETTKAVTS